MPAMFSPAMCFLTYNEHRLANVSGNNQPNLTTIFTKSPMRKRVPFKDKSLHCSVYCKPNQFFVLVRVSNLMQHLSF